MITELLEDLKTKINSVPALAGKVGFQVGGSEVDPTMTETPIPFGWIVFGGVTPQNSASEGGRLYRISTYDFSVLVGIGYGTVDADFLTTFIPILEAAAQAVSGTQANNFTDQWNYSGCELHSVYANRLIYSLTFSINGHHTTY